MLPYPIPHSLARGQTTNLAHENAIAQSLNFKYRAGAMSNAGEAKVMRRALVPRFDCLPRLHTLIPVHSGMIYN